MAWVPALDDMAWKRASTGRGSMPPQITSFEPHARPPDSFRKPRQGDLILFSQISSIRNEGRHEGLHPTSVFGLRSNDHRAHRGAARRGKRREISAGHKRAECAAFGRTGVG